MLLVELISALLAPALEIFAPVLLLFAEFIFWLVLIIGRLVVALVRWQKPEFPTKPRFSAAHGKLTAFSNSWRQKWGKNQRG
ncbi:hypothetical protein [Rheinheimera aquimaris]|jgi:hypothetical protein|uniref:hypothetical protein n=1 Tax=Rheinheimera aquimaris TaxID=412437 RepID=UPI0010660983|nr:hypothetical protein [Rheinheimera aquimaris]|tara:strand:- start:5409 stop:5654 length:246 start_codon:yes stop_codon:yes gene_type:complete